MKPFSDLTRLGQIRRMHALARNALGLYPLKVVSIKQIWRSDNYVYDVRAYLKHSKRIQRFAFKVSAYDLNHPHYRHQNLNYYKSEIFWLDAIARQTDIVAPRPIQGKDGQFIQLFEHTSIPGHRFCTLFEWVHGYSPSWDRITPRHLYRIGRAMALLQEHGSTLNVPSYFNRPRRDLKATFGENGLYITPLQAAWLKPSERRLLGQVADKVRYDLQELGEGPDSFGLIHGDWDLQTNSVFTKDEARPLDFDGCHWGPHMIDVGKALVNLVNHPVYPSLVDGLFSGFHSIKTLPDAHIQKLSMAFNFIWWRMWSASYDSSRSIPNYKERFLRYQKVAIVWGKSYLNERPILSKP